MAGTKGRSGGRRPGSGVKPQRKTISEKAKKRWESAARKFKKDTGMTVEDFILGMLVDDKVQDTSKIGAAKLYCEALIAKVSEQTVVNKTEGPAIGLPPRRQDPALEVVKGGK